MCNKTNKKPPIKKMDGLAGEEGFEPSAYGFGDRSTTCVQALQRNGSSHVMFGFITVILQS